MRRRALSYADELLPRGPGDLLLQLTLFLGCYGAYVVVRAAIASGELAVRATANATRIISAERALHVFAEPAIQSWASGSRLLITLVDVVYLNAHFLVTLCALVYVYLRRNDRWPPVRDTFLIAMALALAGYALFPTAPPRLLPQYGFTDSIRQFSGISLDHGTSSAFVNVYAAVPSMHVCFAAMLGASMWRLVNNRLARLAWLAYPLLISFVVVATGNHYLTDVVLGALTAGLALALAQARARVRAHAPISSADPAEVIA